MAPRPLELIPPRFVLMFSAVYPLLMASLGVLNILLAEENEEDIRAFTRAQASFLIESYAEIARDGEEAMRLLRKPRGLRRFDKPIFHMIFLDTYLPKISGFQILHEIRRDPYLRYTPVIMLAGNHDGDTIVRCYEERANCCLPKPVTPADFNQVAGALLTHEFYRNAA